MSARRAARGFLVVLAAVASLPAWAAEPAPPAAAEEEKPPRVEVERLDGVTAYYARPEGLVLSVAVPKTTGGSRELLLLVAPKPPKEDKKKGEDKPDTASVDRCGFAEQTAATSREKPRRLIRVDAKGDGALTVVREDLADASAVLTADVNGDGRDDLLVIDPTGISAIAADPSGGFSGAFERVATLPRTSGARQVGVLRNAAGAVTIWTPELGALRTFTHAPAGAWVEGQPIPLPLHAKKESSGLALTGSEVFALHAPSEPALLATAPDLAGGDRLISYLLHPDAAGAEARSESWSHLPASEKLLESSYVSLDGAPALFVSTRPSTKLSLFGEKLVRVFPLGLDRTRMGKAPAFAVASGANLWQVLYPVLVDLTGDGRDDLVLGYWKGLMDNTVVLDAYARRADGTFDPKARTTTFDLDDADRGTLEYGLDVDGRDRPDLLLSTGASIQLHRGTAAGSDVRKLVEGKPAWKAPLPGSSSAQNGFQMTIGDDDAGVESFRRRAWDFEAIDLDGDGRKEVLCVPPEGVQSNAIAVYRPGAQ